MIAIFTLIGLTAWQALTGIGLLKHLGIRLTPGLHWPLAVLNGMIVFSLTPFLLQLATLPLTALWVFLTLGIITIILNLPVRNSVAECRRLLGACRIKVKVYEIPFILVVTAVVAASVWRCFYYPPSPRDLTSGAEVIAEYAVREKTMINSLFTVNLETTNNQYKPPFITSLQIIYKYAGFPFGQLWVSTVFISFLLFIYHAMRRYVHRLIAWSLVLVVIAVPEMYAYTFMALFDYSNAVYFFIGAWLLVAWYGSGERPYLQSAGWMMGCATYIRSETLVLVCLMALPMLWDAVRKKISWTAMIGHGCLLILPALALYLLSITIYCKYYLPGPYDIGGLVNSDLFNLAPLWQRIVSVNGELIFSNFGLELYGCCFFLFLAVLLADLVMTRSVNRNARNWLFAALVVYLGLPFLGYLLPLLDIMNSTKRGLFKLFPLLVMYMSASNVLLKLSQRVEAWEAGSRSV